MKTRMFRLARMASCMLLTLTWLAPGQSAASPIESGQYFSDTLSTNNLVDPYYFDARPGETVLIRLACEDENVPYVPDISVYSDMEATTKIADGLTDAFVKQDLKINVSNYSWHAMYVQLPMALDTYSNKLSYSVSILRMPNAPLSYADLDVGPILSGEALDGTINVGADLDAGTFAISNNCRLQIRMGQGAPILVPAIQLFDPDGQEVTNIYTPEYRAEITSPVLTMTGIYTVACNDKFNSRGTYVLSMVKIPGEIDGDDKDIGPIINGETKTGMIDKPGDLDVAFFNAVPDDVISIVMRAATPALNPVMELYGPDASLIAQATDILQQSVSITNLTVTAGGKYTLILKDAEDRFLVDYDLTLTFVSGPSTESLPETPTGLTATDGVYSNYIQVSWNSAGGALGYDLWRSQGTNNPMIVVTNLNTTVYQDYGVVTNTSYYYKVKSRNSYGVSTNFSNTDAGWCGITIIPVSEVRDAITVGIDNYSPAYPGGQPSSLEACVNDALGIKDEMLLGDPSNHWSAADIQMFTDRQATKSTLRNALQNLAASAGAGDLILYTHSSHGGAAGDDTFICAYDDSYFDYEMADDLARFRADTRVVLIIDTCHSAGMFKDGRPAYWPFVERVMTHYRRIKTAEYRAKGLPLPRSFGDNIAFMTACDADELSAEIGAHGLYTGYLLEACGKTDLDVNLDGRYSFKELHDYAAEKTPLRNPNQHPQFYNGALLSNTIARGVGVVVPGSGAFIYNDYDADRVSDVALYHEASGAWYIGSLARYQAYLQGQTNWQWLVYGTPFGGPGWRPIAGDYDGDGYADAALYNETAGLWMVGSVRRMRVLFQNVAFGQPGWRPIAGDYDGDGVFDGALYARHDNGYWYVLSSRGNVIDWEVTWTGPGFTAVPGDYDGDGAADYALYHDSSGYWYILTVEGEHVAWGYYFGAAGFVPVPGDYDGDGIFDLAVYQPVYGIWSAWSLVKKAFIAEGIVWGGAGWQPVPGDYDGDGIYDLAVYNEAASHWRIRTIKGSMLCDFAGFGGPGYQPVLPSLW